MIFIAAVKVHKSCTLSSSACKTIICCCKMSVRVCSVYIIVAVLFSSACVCWGGEGSGCGSVDLERLMQQRLENLLGNIEAQLTPLIAPYLNDTAAEELSPPPANDSVLRMYHALLNSSGDESSEYATTDTGHVDSREDDYCRDGAFYAQPVTSFNVEMNINEGGRRGRPVHAVRKLLVEYTASFHFHLNDSLQDISRADLLVYQLPTRTSPSVVPRDYRQYVEISTVIHDKERHLIEGKYIDTFGDGFVVFEITKAVELWINHNIEGPVVLDMDVYCYSSPYCADVDDQGKRPAVVKFLVSHRDIDKTPRVIVNSYPQVDSVVSHMNKRSTHEDDDGLKFCTSEEEICCLQPLTINFKEDLQLTKVLYPPTFEANYCQGICPTVGASAVLTSERYTFLSTLGNNHPAASIEPCCAGEQYEHVDVVLSAYNREAKRFEIQIIKLHQVRVVGCRCA